jgi:hypothetical protein
MPKIRSAGAIGDKWARVTPERAEDYKIGVTNPKKDWAAETKAAETNYEAGVKSAMTRKAFGKGVDKAGTAKWQEGALKKGVDRFGPGVMAGQDNYEKGFAPYRDVIEHTVLPTRYPKGDPRNIERVKAIAKALHDKKLAG